MIISGRAKVVGVMGWPIAHSLSPRLHNYWLEKYGIDGILVPLAVPNDQAESAFRILGDLGFVGTFVTLPHKEKAFACADEVDAAARRLGAVNMLTVRSDGSLYGQNTDGFGFLENLREGAPTWRGDAGPATVLGAGGAARAVIGALIDAGVPEIRVINRTLARAEKLVEDFSGPLVVQPWEMRAEALAETCLLVNTTQLGMEGQPSLELDLSALPKEAIVNDIVYTPLTTPLLRDAALRGNTTVDGLGMLLHQARPGFSAWFGVEPEVSDDVRVFVMSGGEK